MGTHETATFGGGCFWCVEAAVEQLDGVEAVTSGYAGGHAEDPSYKEVCSGTTGHAEVVQVEYDPDVVTYAELLEVLFKIHNPTTKDREGPDVGSQYRSLVLYHDEDQRETIEAFVDGLEREGVYDAPIVTDIEPLEEFYPAEERHQDYYAKNPGDRYCQFNADPKIQKVREAFAEKVKGKGTTADD
jgi:peptide-methionine (S)-S-oxide reductase